MGRPDLATPQRYGAKRSRVRDRDAVNGLVREFTTSHDRDEVIRLCSEGDVPCGKICSIADIFEEEQFWTRDTLMRVKDERLGELAVQGVIPKLSQTPGEVRHLGAPMGSSTAEVLERLAGIDADTLERLRDDGVV